jgi:hypothetical protein
MKPKELMTEKELEEYHLARRKAILQGDSGVLPDGRTVQQAREDYIEQCKTDPMRTRPGMETIEAAPVPEPVKSSKASKLKDDSE